MVAHTDTRYVKWEGLFPPDATTYNGYRILQNKEDFVKEAIKLFGYNYRHFGIPEHFPCIVESATVSYHDECDRIYYAFKYQLEIKSKCSSCNNKTTEYKLSEKWTSNEQEFKLDIKLEKFK